MICHFDCELDDQVAARICLRCYCRETDSAKPMPKSLRRQLIALLAAITA
jgi:hypothetical protein